MFSQTDTIVAIATPPGRGGIGVVRLSGSDAHAIARRLITAERDLAARHATFTRIRGQVGQVSQAGRVGQVGQVGDAIDHAVVTYFPAPRSYTGDDVVELSVHGSPVVLRSIVTSAIACGARAAEPGEFTLRAFLNGRLDLVQAEAVADLIDAVTPLQARTAFDQLDGTLTTVIGKIDAELFDLVARLEASVDFPDEGYHFIDPETLAAALDRLVTHTGRLLDDVGRGRLVREGLQVVIVGSPNVGKSSLFNALAGADRAIVTDIPGTTRDLVTEVVEMNGLRVTLVDTAGLRESRDVIEAEGMVRSRGAQDVSDLILVVVDGSQPLHDTDRKLITQTPDDKRLVVSSKADLSAAWNEPAALRVSARTGAGLDCLRREIAAGLDVDLQRERPSITNVRHVALVRRAHDAIDRASAALRDAGGSLSEEFVLADLQDARAALEEVAGRRASDDVLQHIFERFCIGK